MDYFARQNMVLPHETGNMIKNIRILIIGMGAAGNAVAENLVLMGFCNITNIDFDVVEDSNLSRTALFRKSDIGKSKALVAAERLKEMALAEQPYIVGLHGNLMTDFGKGLFMRHDIVISCVDTQQCRAFISDWCVRTKRPFFEVGFEGFNVNVTFFAPDDGYEQLSDGKLIDRLPTDDGLFPKVLNDFKICLREEIGQGRFDNHRNSCSGFKIHDENLVKIPTIQTASTMAGALVATELVKYLSGQDTLRNKILYYYGLRHEAACYSYKPDPKCLIHQEHLPIETLCVTSDDTLRDILLQMHHRWQARPLIQIPPFVFSGRCACCGREMKIGKRASEMYDDERWCDDCRKRHTDYAQHLTYPNQWRQTPTELSLASHTEWLQLKPCDIGIPDDDILLVTLVSNDHYRRLYVRLKPRRFDIPASTRM